MKLQWFAAATVLALVAAGCGREVGEGPPADEGAAPAACQPGETDGDLLLYNWSEYLDPDLVDAFEEEYGVSVTEDFYPSNEELLARVESGGAQYDVIVPSDYMVEIMADGDLLLELDHEAIPNVANVASEFADPPYDPGMRFSMPYQWGTTGLGVNVGAVGEVEPSWALVFEPDVAGELPGRISLLDDAREAMAAALMYLGYSPNTVDEDELQAAADLIAGARDWIAAFDSDLFADLVMTSETVVSHGYSGGFLDAFGEDEDYEYLIPEEGAIVWTDNMAILADTPHPCTAHTFLNFMLDGQNAAQLTNWTYYASPVAAADEFIEPEILEDEVIYPSDEVWEHLTFLEDTGDAEVLFTDYFTRAKS